MSDQPTLNHRPLKVVDVAEFYADLGGGVKTYINEKLEAGARLGHEVVVIAPGPEDAEEERLGGRIIWVKGPEMPFDPRYYVLWNEQAVHDALDREQPDVVEGSSPWSGGWFAARWKGDAAKSFIFHQDPVAVYPQTLLGGALGTRRVNRLFGWYWSYLRKLAANYDTTVVAGHWLADKLDRFGVNNPQAIPFGITRERFSPQKRDDAIRSDLLDKCGVAGDQQDDATLWVNISRFHPEKRLGTLFKAFERARASSSKPMGLVIFGDGPMRSWVRRKAKQIDGVHLVGFVEDRTYLARALASCDAMVHGSAAETYGLVVAEGMCSGLPIVVPDTGGAADFAGPQWSETYAPGDAAGCAAAMARLARRGTDNLRPAAIEAANARVGTMNDHFEQLFAYYAELVETRRS